MKTRSSESLHQLADRWAVVMRHVHRHIGPYPDQIHIEVATLISEIEHVIEPDAFDQDVLHTARKLAMDGKLKIALFKLHEILESGGSARNKSSRGTET